MSPRGILVIVLALICGTSAAFGVSGLRGGRRVIYRAPQTAPVVVASSAMARGQMVTARTVAVQQWPRELVPPGAVGSLENAVDRSVTAPVLPGEPILEGKLASRDSGRGLAALVPQGMRAYTIQTSRTASNVAGFILPGNRVDVLLTLRGSSNDFTGGGSSTTLLQAVEVLAVDQRLDAPAENRMDPKQTDSVTLLVSPKDAALLDLGQNMGQLTLSLRNPEDLAEADTQPATLDLLRFTQRQPDGPATTAGDSSRLARCLASVVSATLTAVAHTSASPRPAPAKPRQLEIRTLRGRHPGRVVLSGPAPDSSREVGP